jgi:tight adherence protein C
MQSDIKLYIGILVFGFAMYKILSSLFAKNEEQKSLQWASSSAPVKSKSAIIEFSRQLSHQFTLQHALRIKNPKYRKDIERLIETSGLAAELNVDEFIALQLLWGIVFPIICLFINFLMSLNYPMILFLAIIPFGFYVPRIHANAQRKQRQTAVLADLPFYVDLMALASEAGLDLQGGMKKIVEKSNEDSVLAQEFNRVLSDIAIGKSRADALKDFAKRIDLNETNSLVNVIVDSESTGASVTKVLKEQSIQMRLERFVRAEKAGARASQAILFPMIFFIIPAIFIMVLAPVALNLMSGK